MYTGEQFDPNSGFYYLRARYMNPANGRFTRVDEFDGYVRMPSSLNDYTYASADSVNNRDPSGYETMAGLTQVNSAQMGMRGAAPTASRKALDITRKTKVAAVHVYQVFGKRFHTYIFLENLLSPGAGFRFDVGGVSGGWGAIWSRPLGHLPGKLWVSPVPPDRLNGRKILTAAKLTVMQAIAWRMAVGLEAEDEVDIRYSLVLGVNCTYWSGKAALTAFVLSKTGL
jgi:RHS repeat-associated protein